MSQHYQTPILPFPALPGADTHGVERRGCFVETTPCVGGNAVRLTYVDAEFYPRIAFEADLSVPQEMLEAARRFLKAVGDDLPPLLPSRRPPTRSRLLR